MFICPTAHPAYVLRGARPITDILTADLAKAWRIAQEGAPRYRANIICVLPQSPGGLQKAFETAMSWLAFAKQHKIPTAVDVETSSLEYFNCKFYSISLAWAEPYNTAVAFTLCDYHTLQMYYEQRLIYAAQEILADEEIMKIFHNGPFDRSVLHFKGFKLAGKCMDTQGLAHLYQPDMPKSLDWIGHTWLDVRPWKLNHKGDKLIHTKDPWELLYYNGEDALNTGLLVEPMIADLIEHQANPHLIDVQMGYADLATDMEIAGLPINLEKRREMGKELLVKMAKAKHKMREWLNWPDFNPMSDNQRREILFGPKYAVAPWNLGLQATILTEKKRQPSTGYRSIIDHMEHPFVTWLADYIESRQTYATQFREKHDLERQKLKDLHLDEELADFNRSPPKSERGGAYQRAVHLDGRLHYKCNPTGQKGTRFSTSPNCQNQKAKFRKFFEAPPGRVLVSADLDQLELRITACLAGVEPLLEEMRKPGGDPHMLACAKIYPNFWDRGDKEREQLRTYVKTVTYAALYMAQLLTVRSSIRERKDIDPAMRAAMTIPRVRHIYEGYFGLFPEIPRYHEAKMDLIKTQGFLACPPFDRKRYFPVYPPAFNEVANWDIQTCGAEVVSYDMCRINEALKRHWPSAKMVLHLHDQYVLECDEGDADAIARQADQLFGQYVLEGPRGPVRLSGESLIAQDLYSVKSEKAGARRPRMAA
jgi:DNA polymerase-1